MTTPHAQPSLDARPGPTGAATPRDLLDAELREEFDFHLEMLACDARRDGHDETTVTERALRRFGSPERYLRRCRAIVLGETAMQRRVLIAWNIVLTVALVFTSLVAWRAYERAVGPLIMPSRPGPTQPAISDRTAILKSLWCDESGVIEVKGSVAQPGSFQTSLQSPLGLARLVELAGGTTEGARYAAVKRPDLNIEYFVSLKNANRRPDETQLMPEPGSIIEIR